MTEGSRHGPRSTINMYIYREDNITRAMKYKQYSPENQLHSNARLPLTYIVLASIADQFHTPLSFVER